MSFVEVIWDDLDLEWDNLDVQWDDLDAEWQNIKGQVYDTYTKRKLFFTNRL